jgi:hypothetical protein
VADAAIVAFAGSGKPYIPISGMWIYGTNPAISEQSPISAPAMVAWKPPIERRVLGPSDMRGVVIVSGTAYGDAGGGIPGAVAGSDQEARARLGDQFAEVLLLDQGTDAARARAELGWQPSHPSLTDEFRHGSYRK